ncbi:MAG: hypothetical protein SGI98_02085 [Verrucomicrobiota bacterium]|nr:hypothetical protein [Verrucomicrobiota bacterium]
MNTFGRLVLLLLLVTFLTGCSTIQSRTKERQGAFNALSPNDKQLVQQGMIRTGMNTDAVYIAMGTPTRKKIKQSDKGDFSSWYYDRTLSDTIPQWSYAYAQDDCGNVVAYPYYDPIYTYYNVPFIKVTFKNGKVIQWEQK